MFPLIASAYQPHAPTHGRRGCIDHGRVYLHATEGMYGRSFAWNSIMQKRRSVVMTGLVERSERVG